jgi:hypothetical protein
VFDHVALIASLSAMVVGQGLILRRLTTKLASASSGSCLQKPDRGPGPGAASGSELPTYEIHRNSGSAANVPALQ